MGMPAPARVPDFATLVIALIVVACAAPSGTDAPPPTASPEPPSPTPIATPQPTPTPTPTRTPTPTCAPIDYSTFVASDRLTNIALAPGSGSDLLGFTFAASPGSPVRPHLTVTAVEPPFMYGGSGLPFDVAGAHHIRVKYEGMSHVDASGNLVYVGPSDLAGIGGPIAQVVLEEAFEGYVTFIVGYDGDGCVALQVTPSLVTIAIEAR